MSVLLVLLLTVGALNPAAGPPIGLLSYGELTAEYQAGDRETALRRIRRWRRGEIREALRALREEGDRREKLVLPTGEEVGELPVGMDFELVEAAALMHVEAGLRELQSLDGARAESQLSAATSLVEWSHKLKAERARERVRLLANLRRPEDSTGELDPALWDELNRALLIDLKIDPREFYVALAAGTLAVGFPETALGFAEKARKAAPLDGEALLLSACVKEGLALGEEVRTHERKARRLREEAAALFREALDADPAQIEARLRLGGLLLAQGRPQEAEPLLQQVAEQARDNERRYLALLLLGRASELRENPDAAAASYRLALEAWPHSQAARLALARCLEGSAGPSAAHPLVLASLLDSREPAREPDPWWSYPSGPRGLAKVALERLWQGTLGRSFGP
ncbi:MAG: tetratricopeptide repeat protein [Acidobacteria bacterium]|jgi:tetratricopeptide (TPR) repeat protein|nr:tetratricopeptide repeat protein [Acidobacteriota bacterium]